jgi:TctA family transporter
MLMGDGGWSVFFARNISIFLMLAIVALLALPILRALFKYWRVRTVSVGE